MCKARGKRYMRTSARHEPDRCRSRESRRDLVGAVNSAASRRPERDSPPPALHDRWRVRGRGAGRIITGRVDARSCRREISPRFLTRPAANRSRQLACPPHALRRRAAGASAEGERDAPSLTLPAPEAASRDPAMHATSIKRDESGVVSRSGDVTLPSQAATLA